MRRVLILAVITIIINSIRLRHLVNQTYNPSIQLEKVTSQQKRFEQQFLALSSEVQNINKQLTSSNSADQRIDVLETSLLQWRQDVFDLSKTIIPAFNFSRCSCQNMTVEQKNRVLNDIYALKKSVEQLKNRAEQMERCDKVQQVLSDVNKQLFFLDSMSQILTTGCHKSINIGPTIFQTNLYADNWILGNFTPDDIMSLYNQRLTLYDNVTNCPLSRPFFDGRVCIRCPINYPVFNIQTSRCVNCPPGQHVDNVQKKCMIDGIPNNTIYNNNKYAGGLIAPMGYTPNTTYQMCPIDRPYFDGFQCVSCTYPNNLYNVTSRTCVSCPAGKIYSSQKRDCIDKPISWRPYNTNPKASNIISNYTFERNPNYEDCPPDLPFWNGNQCIFCEQPNNLFNYSSRTCTSCPRGTYYDQAQQQCKAISGWNETTTTISQNKTTTTTVSNGTSTTPAGKQYNTNPLAPRIISKQRIIREPNLQDCPIERPYFDGYGCMACDGVHDIFNYDTKQCTSCGPGEVYSPDSLSCERSQNINTTFINTTDANWTHNPIMVSNLTNKNWITSEDPGRIYQQISRILKLPNARKCPEGRQFWNGSECIGCVRYQYFSFDSKHCEACPEDQRFSLNMHRCVKFQNPNTYQTNPVNTSNIIYDGIAGIEYLNIYKSNKDKYPNIRDCPPDRPYYDGQSCIACKPPFPYFNINQKVCQQCPNDTVYNPNNHECETTEGKVIYQGPTLEKMLAGIF